MRVSSAALRAEQDVTQWGGRNDGRRDDGFWEVGVGNGVSGARGRSSGSGGPEATAAGRGPKPKARGESAAIGVPTSDFGPGHSCAPGHF